jgi:NADPH-dependent 2,4-dienoyl-CoA reductase/sulfur reductase-like enzyme
LRAPALNPVSCWRVEQRDEIAYVREKLETAGRQSPAVEPRTPGSIVILGGGAAGNAAAEMLRREGYTGRITMLSADESLPCDRPNLSKGYLSGGAPEETNPLRSAEFYRDHRIDLKLLARATSIDTANRHVQLVDGSRYAYDALLLATGADPVRLEVSGADLPHVHYLRTVGDSRALIAKAATSRRAVVIGASFIGLEVGASLRTRNIEGTCRCPGSLPMEHILGREVGQFFRTFHEQHGVKFHLGATVTSIDAACHVEEWRASRGRSRRCGIGVRPVISLAEQAGLAIDRGVTVNEYLETSVPGSSRSAILRRWPDRLTDERIRVEHWVVAERQGQTAARNILDRRERFDCVPFFWTEQYDFGLGYVGHAERWDKVDIAGSLEARDCTVSYWLGGRKLAVAIVHRDLEGLRAEVEFERRMATKEAPE